MKQHNYYVYILLCSDNSLYVGMTNDLDRRFSEHNNGYYENSYTYSRRPVKLIYSSQFSYVHDAKSYESQIKKWSRNKKLALVMRDWDTLESSSRKKFKK
ncbi:MAG: GIY-YIG nuclease family protein [Candidatus Dojkabacteria bacterium]|nr:GIY-YIG nuclease family protein [Candidatus Dojkabacteria bacterium]MDQ7020215.1 GIY-YIG nuclease family protein [Candidatus Dojkabacteria bacterium]